MRDRINTLPVDQPMDYRDRLRILRDRKIEDTKDKAGVAFYQDGDDYGSIMPPKDFSFTPIPTHKNGGFYGLEGFSKNFYKLMEEHPVFIDPVDAFTNRWMLSLANYNVPGFHPDYPYDHLQPLIELYGIQPGIGANAHFGGDFSIGLQLGFGGLLEKIEKYRAINPSKSAFYDAQTLTIQGIQQWIRHTIEATEQAILAETHQDLKENLRQMLCVNQHLLYGAPRTLREACQWICWFNMVSRTYNRDGAGDQLDALLLPYYLKDKADQAITDDQAKYYIACLLLNDPHYYQLGGLDEHDQDRITPFSYLILEAADWLDSSCNITVRVHDKMDMAFLHKSVDYLFTNKNGWPRFSGDKALCEGLLNSMPDLPLAIARKRVAVGCHWMSLPGLEYTLNDCVKINVLKVFEVAFQEMMADSTCEKSVSHLFSIFTKHLSLAVEATAAGIDFHLKHQMENQPELPLNLLSHGPIERGLDISGGGAQYYNMCIDGSALATVSDSFAALVQRIEIEGRLTWEEVAHHLATNFEEQQGDYVRNMLLASPRYGGGDTLGDQYGVRVSDLFSTMVHDRKDRYPYTFIPGWFSWSNTIVLGKMVGATPNGRKAYEPINHGANPHPGFRKDGALTSMSNTICSVQPKYGNTAPIQLELDPGMARDPEAVQKIADYILTIFEKGATLLNINIIDAKKILEADQDPAKFPELVVRVTGFTAYFSLLTPEFRKLVVDRILTAC